LKRGYPEVIGVLLEKKGGRSSEEGPIFPSSTKLRGKKEEKKGRILKEGGFKF